MRILGGTDLLLVDEDVGIFQFGGDRVLIGDEVRRQVASVELHALYDDDFGIRRLSFLDGNDAVGSTDELHGLGQLLADLGVVVRGDGGDLGNFFLVLGVDLLGQTLQFFDDFLDGLGNAARQGHGIVAGGDHLETFAVNGLGEDGGGGSAVAGHITGLAGRLLDELRPHVLIGIGQFNLLGHGDAVLGDGGTPPSFIKHGIAAAQSQGAAHRPRQLADAGQ